jgi:hypothetical protein
MIQEMHKIYIIVVRCFLNVLIQLSVLWLIKETIISKDLQSLKVIVSFIRRYKILSAFTKVAIKY